ncbi:MAG: phytanoyl-CoA dioxygenase family protein [Micromonosporaceae bacterium]
MTAPALTARLAAEVRAKGYAIWPEFLSPARCAALRDLAQALAESEHANHYPGSTRVWDLFRHGQPFTDLLTDPCLSALLNSLLGEHHLLSDFSLNVVHPGQPVDNWHIDYPYNEMPSPVTGSILGLQCVLALDQFHEGNGATQLVPGSDNPPRNPDPQAIDQQVVFCAEPGTLLVMAAATWHRSGVNASGARRSAALLSFVERWVRPMSDPPEPGPWTSTDALRTLLGTQRPPDTINGVPV